MPIDPNIIAGLRPLQIQQQDPMEQYGKSLTLRHLMMQGDQAQQANQDDAAVRAAYQQAGGDSKRLRSILEGGGQYRAVQALDKFDLDQRAKNAEIKAHEATAGKNEYETQIGKVQHVSSIMSTATDQPTWDLARRVMSVTFPEMAPHLPPQFDPAFVKAKVAEGQTIAQRLEDQRKAEQAAETARHNKGTEATAAAAAAETARHNRYAEANPGLQHLETPDGVVAFNPRGGTAKPILGPDGQPIQGGKGLNEAQGKAAGMAMRAQTSHDLLSDLETAGTATPSLVKMGVEKVPVVGGGLGMIANKYVASPDQQRVDQAQRDFVNAALRVESGASINESEFNNARRQYFTQPGDSPETIAQKKRNRETEIESLKMQAGPAAKKALAEAKIAADERRKNANVSTTSGKDVAKMSDDEILSALGIKK